jgi:hypothetical protein
LELYTPTADPNAFPHCSIGVWAIGQITWSGDCTAKDVHQSLCKFFHLDKLNPELRDVYNTLITAIVVRNPPDMGSGADHDRSEPKWDQDYLINGQKDVLLEEDQCAIIASTPFIEFLNKYGASFMKFLCYTDNIPFLVETGLAVLNPEQTDLDYAIQFHILMESLTPQSTFNAFPCNDITCDAMKQDGFKNMLTGIPDWRRRLTEEGFTFLNDVLVKFLGLTTFRAGACEAYIFLIHRVKVVMDKKPQSSMMEFCPWIRKKRTFTLSRASAPSLVDDRDRIVLTLEEATAIYSPGFIAYIKEHWGTFRYPVVGHEENPDLCMRVLWDYYHTSCFPLAKPRRE